MLKPEDFEFLLMMFLIAMLITGMLITGMLIMFKCSKLERTSDNWHVDNVFNCYVDNWYGDDVFDWKEQVKHDSDKNLGIGLPPQTRWTNAPSKIGETGRRERDLGRF